MRCVKGSSHELLSDLETESGLPQRQWPPLLLDVTRKLLRVGAGVLPSYVPDRERSLCQTRFHRHATPEHQPVKLCFSSIWTVLA